jgi:hypothetical protein
MLVFMGCWSEAPEKTAIRKAAVRQRSYNGATEKETAGYDG